MVNDLIYKPRPLNAHAHTRKPLITLAPNWTMNYIPVEKNTTPLIPSQVLNCINVNTLLVIEKKIFSQTC